MKKIIAVGLVLVCMLGLVACSSNDTNNSMLQTEETNTTINFETDSSDTIDGDANIKAELIGKYGDEFKFYLPFGMELIRFTFDEKNVVREHLDSMKDYVPTHNATWDIVDGELVITGEWNETFILDLEANIAISKTDGREYPIYKVERLPDI